MPGGALTGEVMLRAGPLVIETLVKHYFDSLRGPTSSTLSASSNNANAPKPSRLEENRSESDGNGKSSHTKLRQDELLYDEAFNLVRQFLNLAAHHTVEEVQSFANTRTPSPFWVHVVRTVVPLSTCDKAAKILIKTLGGPEHLKRTVGGFRWWQVRGIPGVDGQWITAKKDWQEAKRKSKLQEQRRQDSAHGSTPNKPTKEQEPAVYEEEMDSLRCMLYIHGGGYYFGSVDQERYNIQRHARKMNGRVFAVNYRLAPQYPFPCALQDVLAAYLYLIEPPPNAPHRPVKPEHIVIGGDSAGGGLSIALLQIIRDSGLPAPAGGILVSPWSDLTHSFPSIGKNTDTDVMPLWGLSIQRPSPAWPPPNDEATPVHSTLRSRIQEVLHRIQHHTSENDEHDRSASPLHVPSAVIAAPNQTVSPPRLRTEAIILPSNGGEEIKIEHQIQLYAPNSLLGHPLISPVMSYLGGLPPLYIMAGEKEVLRDEIIYLAHKAAHPGDHPVQERAKKLYPILEGIESRHKPTWVHLQVYDDAAHVLPVLFSFTTPAKFCFRAIATFTRHITKMEFLSPPNSPSMRRPSVLRRRTTTSNASSSGRGKSEFNVPATAPLPSSEKVATLPGPANPGGLSAQQSVSFQELSAKPVNPPLMDSYQRPGSGLRRAVSARVARMSSYLHPEALLHDGDEGLEFQSDDVGGPRFSKKRFSSYLWSSPHPEEKVETTLYAGDPKVYLDTEWDGTMIRERVSTQGVIRPLEPASELPAMQMDEEQIGQVSGSAVYRHLETYNHFQVKYAPTITSLKKSAQLHASQPHPPILFPKVLTAVDEKFLNYDKTAYGVKEGLMINAGMFTWARIGAAAGNRAAGSENGQVVEVAIMDDDEEIPPPSSITAKRSLAEAKRLARSADHAMYEHEQRVSGNRLWSSLINFFTVNPEGREAKILKQLEKGKEKEKISGLPLDAGGLPSLVGTDSSTAAASTESEGSIAPASRKDSQGSRISRMLTKSFRRMSSRSRSRPRKLTPDQPPPLPSRGLSAEIPSQINTPPVEYVSGEVLRVTVSPPPIANGLGSASLPVPDPSSAPLSRISESSQIDNAPCALPLPPMRVSHDEDTLNSDTPDLVLAASPLFSSAIGEKVLGVDIAAFPAPPDSENSLARPMSMVSAGPMGLPVAATPMTRPVS